MKEKTRFVLHKHFARTLHFDLRLHIGKTLKSWAVPKGAPKRIGTKHLAILVDDHPLSYADFEGVIPEGQYGAGEVLIFDQGVCTNVKSTSFKACMRKGVLEFQLQGKRLKGSYALIHFREKNWLWIKVRTKR